METLPVDWQLGSAPGIHGSARGHVKLGVGRSCLGFLLRDLLDGVTRSSF
jgi:hypothetical protein